MAPISAIGERREQGFTLVEILVVLVILGLLAGTVLLAAPQAQPSLTAEAERLAARLTRAGEEAVLTSRSIEVHIGPERYGFDARVAGERRPLQGKAFAGVDWAPGTTIRLVAADQGERILFDPTGLATPAAIDLVRASGRMRVAIDGAGRITIHAGQ